MGNRKNKISKGLNKLLRSKVDNHFTRSRDVFVDDPIVRNSYFELFSQAQLAEVANAEF